MAIRLLGDLDGSIRAWCWGGVLDETAILSFVALVAGLAVPGAIAPVAQPFAAARRRRRVFSPARISGSTPVSSKSRRTVE
ncbi:MAG TPA: hypothetical protein VFN89_07795 [Solirubrobacterales bacterium]|nr:hypothetical protein [Solirubrobacterales bacterium]